MRLGNLAGRLLTLGGTGSEFVYCRRFLPELWEGRKGGTSRAVGRSLESCAQP